MSNPTAQRPVKRRSTASSASVAPARNSGKGSAPSASAAKTNAKAPARANGGPKYRVRQTGRVEGLRDGKPLIFGWGRHLTRAQKLRYQRLGLLGFAALVILAVVGTMVYGVLNETVFIPNSAVVKVNGVAITQEMYRKNLAVEAQVIWNSLQDEITQDAALGPKIQAGDKNAITQDAILQSQVQSNEGKYSQSVLTQTAINDMMDDQLIQNGAKEFERTKHLPATTFDPTQAELDKALADFKQAFPKGETYDNFLSANHMANSDVVAALAIQIRRDKMSKYLATTLVSPVRQAHIRKIEVDTAAKAATVRAALVKGNLSDDTWKTVAKAYSLDPNTKDTGGDVGFVPPGTGDAAIEVWAYAPDRKVGDLSPVIADASGTFDIVQIVAINPSLPVDANTLKSAQDNALPHWISLQHSILGSKVGTPDVNMLTLARNLPKAPNLNAALPTFTPPPNTGFPQGSGLGG